MPTPGQRRAILVAWPPGVPTPGLAHGRRPAPCVQAPDSVGLRVNSPRPLAWCFGARIPSQHSNLKLKFQWVTILGVGGDRPRPGRREPTMATTTQKATEMTAAQTAKAGLRTYVRALVADAQCQDGPARIRIPRASSVAQVTAASGDDLARLVNALGARLPVTMLGTHTLSVPPHLWATTHEGGYAARVLPWPGAPIHVVALETGSVHRVGRRQLSRAA